MGRVTGQAVTTFYSGKGPAVVAQDPSTGKLLYSVYSPNGFSSMQSINVSVTPKNGTALASTGFSGSSSIYVSLSMIDSQDLFSSQGCVVYCCI